MMNELRPTLFSRIRRWAAALLVALRVACVALLAVAAIWLLLFPAPMCAAVALAFALVLAPSLPSTPRALILIALCVAAPFAWWRPVHELSARLDELAAHKDRSGAQSFTPRELAAIYGLNGAMAMGGYLIGFREAAWETALLAVPGPAVRRWQSDFAMGSPKVRQAVTALEARLTEPHAPVTERMCWRDYRPGTDSLRVALALNCVDLTASVEYNLVQLSARVRVEYPRKAVLPLGVVHGRRLHFDEGLYWVLQQRGLLHPYSAEYRWILPTGD